MGFSATRLNVSCSFANPLVQTILGGVLTNILSNKIEQSKLLKLQEIIANQDPANLNHNLEQLTQEAIVWAVKNISFKYKAYCNTEEQKKLLKKTEDDILNSFETIDKAKWKSSEALIRQIDKVDGKDDLIQELVEADPQWPTINEEFPFPQFFEKEFVPNFQLCFGELLKDKDHQQALVAYNRNISTQIQITLQKQSDEIDKLLKGNQELTEEIKKLSRSPIEQFENNIVFPQINIALDEYLQPLHENVQLLVDQNGKIFAGIEDLKKEGQIHTQKIEDLSRKVERSTNNKVLFFFVLPLVSVSLAYLGFRYWQSVQPFVFTVAVEYLSDNRELPMDEALISISYADKTETIETTKYEAIFKGLPSFVRGDSVKVKINSFGFYKIDTTVVAKNILNVSLKRDDTYATMKGRIKDSNSGLPIHKANVAVQEIETITDANGYYEIYIPEAQQKTDQRLIITKDGYKSWERIEPVIKNASSIIQLEKL